MPGLFSLVRSNLASKPLSGALTVIATMLGVAVVTATFATNASIEDGMRQTARAIAGQADLTVEGLGAQDIPAQVVPIIRGLPQVRLVAPHIRKRVFYRTAGARGFLEVQGVDPDVDPVVRTYHLDAGRLLRADD